MEPTPEQLKSFYQRSVRVSNLLLPINLVRFDSRTNRIVMLVGETIQIEILPNGKVIIE
ncbi:DUF6888 family protein [Chlorogloeopsis sp. ULAP02]|uniref:DUF6888 family protein n=1 Tax=Chlorogloeopsis sp. ULAP02 TaxID=3107926 RepID=UPI00398B28C3